MPPIIVNVPSPAGPPEWLTATIGVAGVLIGVIATALVARSREHQKWLWEKRAELYVKVVRILNVLANLYGLVQLDELVADLKPDKFADFANEISDIEVQLFASPATGTELGNIATCNIEIRQALYKWRNSTSAGRNPERGLELIEHARKFGARAEASALEVRDQIKNEMTKSPSILPQLWRPTRRGGKTKVARRGLQ